jgi:hypothetical protein
VVAFSVEFLSDLLSALLLLDLVEQHGLLGGRLGMVQTGHVLLLLALLLQSALHPLSLLQEVGSFLQVLQLALLPQAGQPACELSRLFRRVVGLSA